MGGKICSICKQEKPLEDFCVNRTTSDGKSTECKVCHRARYHEYYLKNKEQILERTRKWRRTEKGRQSWQRYDKAHREQRNKNFAKYRERNREKIRERNRKFYREHKDVVNKWNKKYRESHPDYFAKYYAKYYKHRKEADQLFKLKRQMRNSIYDAFKRKGKTKGSPTEKIVGCSLQQLYDHLVSTWEKNYGKPWNGEPCHIDHILPLALADTEEDIVELCHYTNLQLLKPTDNLTKSAKLLD